MLKLALSLSLCEGVYALLKLSFLLTLPLYAYYGNFDFELLFFFTEVVLFLSLGNFSWNYLDIYCLMRSNLVEICFESGFNELLVISTLLSTYLSYSCRFLVAELLRMDYCYGFEYLFK